MKGPWPCLAALLLLCACAAPQEAVSAAPTGTAGMSAPPAASPATPRLVYEPDYIPPEFWTGDAADFSGEWHRTGGYVFMPVTVTITGQDDAGFAFAVEAWYGDHAERASGTARFTGEADAYWRYEDGRLSGELLFTMGPEGLSVEKRDWLPLGANTEVAGAYTLDEPEYYSSGAAETLGEARLALLAEAVGERYEEFVETPLLYGECTLTEVDRDGWKGILGEARMPTLGYRQKFYVGDDGTACVHFLTGQFYTNRPGMEMPNFLSFD